MFQYLPADIPNEDQKSTAHYVVDELEEALGFNFIYNDKKPVSERARGLPIALAKSTQIRFICSQRRRCHTYVSLLPYSQTRNTRGPREQFNCGGSISVFFPSASQTFDVALQFTHTEHPGRCQFGVPPKIRQWIRDNPRSNPIQQCEDMERALKNGEIQGVNLDIFLSSAQIHYWWRKGFARTAYISDDPWINCEHILKQHPAVNFVCTYYVTDYRSPMLS